MSCKFLYDVNKKDIEGCPIPNKCTYLNSKAWLYFSDVDNKIHCDKVDNLGISKK